MTNGKLASRLAARRNVVVAGLVAVVLVAGLLVATMLGDAGSKSTSDSSDRTQAAPARPQPSSEPRRPAKPPKLSKRTAIEQSNTTITRFVRVTDELLRTRLDPAALNRIAVGYAKGELEAMAAEFEENGWRQQGSARIVDTWTVSTRLNRKPPAMTLGVCVDSSGVTVIDATGTPVPDSGPDRVPHHYTLVFTAGRWKVSDHTFPPESTC